MESHLKLAEQLSSSADEQLSSLFFTTLPMEVRGLIYTEFWRTSGLRQHITSSSRHSSHGAIVHSPCLIDETTPDERYAKYLLSASDSKERRDWQLHLKSDWTIHWRCGQNLHDRQGDLHDRRKPGHWISRPFLPVLLTCKRLSVF